MKFKWFASLRLSPKAKLREQWTTALHDPLYLIFWAVFIIIVFVALQYGD